VAILRRSREADGDHLSFDELGEHLTRAAHGDHVDDTAGVNRYDLSAEWIEEGGKAAPFQRLYFDP
jgi:hypothetical protein